jgi:predicted nuclease of predicted toxin-antitoxin system
LSLLLDENLSPRLVNRLGLLFPGLTHVRDVGLKHAADFDIRAWARDNGFGIVTTDADFVELAQRLGPPPQVIHIEECDFPLRVIEELLRRSAVRISQFQKDSARGLLVLRFAGLDGR